MATILERFKESSPQTFNHQSTTINTTDNMSTTSNHPIIKDETSQRSACPYTNEGKQNERQTSINGVQDEKAKDSPTRSLSPEFLLGSSEKAEQDETAKEGSAEMATLLTCVFCNEIFPNKTALEQHTVTQHYATDKKLYDCSVCEKRFTHRSSRDIHLRVHTGQRPYECDYCKKRFRVSSHLRDHIRTHTGERPFKCGVCGRGFKQSSDMKKHRKTHFKTMPVNPPNNTEATSYMIVRPEDTTAAGEHSPNDLRSPTDQRQNLKLVIKRERKPNDIRSPMDNNTKPVPSNNALAAEIPSGCIFTAKPVSGNKSRPAEKPSEDSTHNRVLNDKTLPTSDNVDPNGNWAGNNYYSHENSVSTIRSTESYLAKNSPAKVAIKRKLDKGSKSHGRNGYEASPYPSMASGFGQIYTSTAGVHFNLQESALMPLHNTELIYNNMQEQALTNQQNTGQTSNLDSHTGSTAVPYEGEQAENGNRLSYDNPTTILMPNQNGVHAEVFCQPEMKKIKTEKLSPNSQEQSTHCHELSTVVHELQTASYEQRTNGHDQPTRIHEQATYSHEQPTYNHDQATYNHEQPTYNHEQPSYNHEQSTGIREQATGSDELTTYTYDQLKESRDPTINIDHEHTYNGDVSTTRNEELTNNHVDVTSIDSVATQRVDNSAYTETQALPNNEATDFPEDNADTLPNDNEVAPSNVTSEPEVIARKPMVVQLRRDKTVTRKPIKLKDEGEDVQCSVCEQAFKNMEEFTAHKCGKNGKSFKCTICNKTFARQTLLRQHMVLHQGSKRFRFKCNYCGRAFRHRSHLRDHERIHTGERPFKCSFCPKAFKQSSDHRKHENLHTGTTRYRCEKCSLDFKRCDALKRHAMMHTKGEVTLIKCEKCRSLFATADGHMSHVCLKRPYRYRCQICPERFTDPDDLRRHCYDLHGEQSTLSCLKCEFCKLEFNTLEKLDDHLGTHLLKKTHRCRTCDQKFSLLNQLVEHVKIHSAASHGPSSLAYDQSEEKRIEEARAIRGDVIQQKETPPNVTVTSHSSNTPARQRYDFIPSKYQPLVHTNPMYGELAVGSWATPHNYYLPLRPKDHGVPRRQDETPPISPRHQPISPRHNPMSSRSITDVSPNDPISSRSTTETYRRNVELSENHPISSRSNTEPYRRNLEDSDNHPISSRSNTEHYRPKTELPENPPISSRSSTEQYRRRTESSEMNPISSRRSTETSEVNPMSSENNPIAARPSTIANTRSEYPETSPTTNAFENAFSTTSFAAYHAIALSRSTHRIGYGQRIKEIKASRHDSTSSPHESTTSRHEPTTRRQKTEVSARPDATARASQGYPVNTHSDSTMANALEIRNNSEDHRNPEESRRYSDDTRVQSDAIQRNSEQTRIHSDEVRSNSDEIRSNADDIRIISERIRSNSGSNQITPQHMQRNLTGSGENLAVFENDVADRRLSNEPTNSHRQKDESHLAQSQPTTVKRKYTCLNCRSEFYHESSLVDHVCDIFSETLYSCLVCKEDFEKYEVLQEHMRTHWKQVVYFKCTLCGHRLRSEELLKEHNLKHLEDARAERSESEGDRDGYHRIEDDKLQDDPPETFITPPGSAKSVTSPVICSIGGNIVTKTTALASERGYNERRGSNIDTEVDPNIELTNQNAVRDDAIPRSGSYVPYYEARKQAPGYLNVFSQGQAMVVSAMHAAMETSGRYHVPNGLLYPPAMSRSRHTIEHH